MWFRFIDDVFSIVKRIQIEELQSHLNKQHESIKFTVEIEQNSRLPFMDLLLQRRDDGSIDTNVYNPHRPILTIRFTPPNGNKESRFRGSGKEADICHTRRRSGRRTKLHSDSVDGQRVSESKSRGMEQAKQGGENSR